jgi:signal transduction histidine kinase
MEIDAKVVARFDEGRMARAIHNLARNAIEAMADRGGKLTLRAGLEGSDLVIAVSDTGPGVPKEIEGRLFQSFVTMGKQGGTGLGLAIVKKIVEEHGGTVSVRSSDQGATFELRIPQPSGATTRPSAPPPSPAKNGRNGHVEARTPPAPKPKPKSKKRGTRKTAAPKTS